MSRYCLIIILSLLLFATSVMADQSKVVTYDRVKKATIFIFKADRGDVRFNHDLHIAEMKSESCIPCHKTDKPTKENTMSRFDQRLAHYFCKGCHREKGRGPTECHECHNTVK